MRKALLVTHVSGFVPQFEMNNVHILQNMGYEVHYASNFHNPSYGDDNSRLEGTGIICHQIDFERSPFKRKNITAYRQLKKLMEEHEFDLVHCHTPMGGALARLAAHNTHTGPVIYTAHGFHFFKGAPLFSSVFHYGCRSFVTGRFYRKDINIFFHTAIPLFLKIQFHRSSIFRRMGIWKNPPDIIHKYFRMINGRTIMGQP